MDWDQEPTGMPAINVFSKKMMMFETNVQIIDLKQTSRPLIKIIGLVALAISTLGISCCSSTKTVSGQNDLKREGYRVAERTIDANGADLYCKIIGNGRPILFIHGGPGLVHNYFLPYMESLLPYGYQLIFYDQRGNGKSTGYNPDSIKLDIFVEDIERIRERLGIDKLILFSHSSGGYLAYLYALEYPQHIDAMICCDNGPLNLKGMQEYSANWNRQLEQVDIRTVRAMPGMGEAAKEMDDESLKVAANRFYDKTKVAGFIVNSRTGSMDDGKGQDIRNRLYRELEETLFDQQEYKKPKVNALLIHGAEDPIPLWAIEQWADILDARLAVISGSNHFPFVEKTDEVSRVINEFLSIKR
jgi:proline iminopeptidase